MHQYAAWFAFSQGSNIVWLILIILLLLVTSYLIIFPALRELTISTVHHWIAQEQKNSGQMGYREALQFMKRKNDTHSTTQAEDWSLRFFKEMFFLQYKKKLELSQPEEIISNYNFKSISGWKAQLVANQNHMTFGISVEPGQNTPAELFLVAPEVTDQPQKTLQENPNLLKINKDVWLVMPSLLMKKDNAIINYYTYKG